MKKTLILLLLLSFSQSQTILSDSITGTYDASGNPYYIVENVYVEGEASFEEGVEIFIGTGDLSIVVQNSILNFNGTETNPILIEGIGGGNGISWDGIDLESNSSLNFSFTTLKNAYSAIQLQDDIQLNVNNSILSFNTYAINFNNSSNSPMVQIINSQIHNNDVGLWSNEFWIPSIIEIINTDIFDNEKGIDLQFAEGSGTCNENVDYPFNIINSKIYENGSAIIFDDGSLSNNCSINFTIDNSEFFNNSSVLTIYGGQDSEFNFSYNLIRNNTGGIYFASDIAGQLNFINNTVAFNQSENTTVYALRKDGGDLNILNNIFYFNSDAVYTYSDHENIAHNSFFGNNCDLCPNQYVPDGFLTTDYTNLNGDLCDINLNLTSNPLLLDNYRLNASSPCIDAGSLLYGFDPDGTFKDLGVFYFDQNNVIEGCMDETACNYNSYANSDDGSCNYPQQNYDCYGNCIADVDCNDECGGSAIEDECGVCDGNGIPDGACDCDGNVEDECGVCDGNGIPDSECDCQGNILDCSGVCGGNAILDLCGICNGDSSSCIDFPYFFDITVYNVSHSVTIYFWNSNLELINEVNFNGGYYLSENVLPLYSSIDEIRYISVNSTNFESFLDYQYYYDALISKIYNPLFFNISGPTQSTDWESYNGSIIYHWNNDSCPTPGGDHYFDLCTCESFGNPDFPPYCFETECDDIDNDGVCDDVDDCVGEYDECGVCNGSGATECLDGSYECNPDHCPSDIYGCTYDIALNYNSEATIDDGTCEFEFYESGDLNNDGTINILDVLVLVNQILSPFTGYEQNNYFD